MTKLRILFLMSSLEVGGAERVFCHLLTSLPRSRFDLHLAVLNGDGPLRQSIPADVTVHDLKSQRVSRSSVSLLRLLWKLRPARAMSTGSELNILLSAQRPLFPPGCRLLIRTSATMMQLDQFQRGWLTQLAKLSYRLADWVVTQSRAGTLELQQRLRLSGSRMSHIYNPVPFERIDVLADSSECPFVDDPEAINILAVGRLDPAKGLDRLIEAFPRLLCHRPSARLWIVGEGSERPKLERLIQTLGITKSARLAGFDANPWRWMRHADLFVLCSHYEALPNSLLEAIACRCPVVTLDGPGGTRELMEQLGLASQIVDRLEDWKEEWFKRPDASVRQSAQKLLGMETIAEQYTRLLLAKDYRRHGESLQTPLQNIERRAA